MRCAAASPRQILLGDREAASEGEASSRRPRSPSASGPGRNSIETNSSPFNSTRSKTRQTFSCVTRRDRMISRRSVSRRSGDIRSGRIRFSAMSSRASGRAPGRRRPCRRSRARVDPVPVAEERAGRERRVGSGLPAGLRGSVAFARQGAAILSAASPEPGVGLRVLTFPETRAGRLVAGIPGHDLGTPFWRGGTVTRPRFGFDIASAGALPPLAVFLAAAPASPVRVSRS